MFLQIDILKKTDLVDIIILRCLHTTILYIFINYKWSCTSNLLFVESESTLNFKMLDNTLNFKLHDIWFFHSVCTHFII